MATWKSMMLPNELLRALYDKGFYEPMPIQSIVLPEAIKSRSNIIGTAQTVNHFEYFLFIFIYKPRF